MPKSKLLDDEASQAHSKAVEAKAAAAAAAADKVRFTGDIVKDKKTGRKGKFVNEYGTNGRASIVIPDGMKRSELWDASSLEIIKKVKRPSANAVQTPIEVPAGLMDDDDVEEQEDESDDG